MKGTLQDKINETGSMAQKIESAEQRIGSRLSQFDLSDVKRKLEAEQMGHGDATENDVKVPDYSQSTPTHLGVENKLSASMDYSQRDSFHKIHRSINSNIPTPDMLRSELQKDIEDREREQNERQEPTGRGHRKGLSSTTIELDTITDDFQKIAETVNAFGKKDGLFYIDLSIEF